MNIWSSLMETIGQAFRPDSPARGLELRIGEVVQASLIEMLDDRAALVRIKGQVLQVQMEAQLPKGTVLSLVVIGQTEGGLLELKVSPFGQGSSNPDSRKMFPLSSEPDQSEFPSLAKLLKNLDIEATPANRKIVNRLLAAELSVSKSLVKTMQALLEPEQHVSRSDMSLETLVNMVRKNIPMTPATFQAMKTLWYGPPLHEILKVAISSRSNVSTGDASGVREGMPSGQPIVASMQESTVQMRVPNDSAKSLSLHQMVSIQDILLDLDQLQQLPPQERGQALQAVVERLGLAHDNQMALLQKNGSDTTVPATLKSLLLAELQVNPNNSGAELALNHLTGQQLMHSLKEDASPFFYHYLALPVQVEQGAGEAKIHLLTRKKEGKRLDPYNCFLYFHLQLPTLGELHMHVQIVERIVSLRLIVEEENRLLLADSDLAFLRQGLQEAGFQLGAVRKEKGSPDLIQPFSQLPLLIASGGFDLKV
ncbi:flagellar hook-length control protein FliK [Effusibacillus consociatus]|uniref:Flagellar hook-length control protein FliK n=1 Tax=Effusibacillus consociatus TaxID=1117041 RepID=A0ABV9Q7R5_9BACL